MSASEPGGVLYFAVLLTEIVVDGPGHVPSFEESFVLLLADSDEHAQDVAVAFARRQEVSYPNEHGETVRWVHRKVVSVEQAWPCSEELAEEHLRVGTELWSRFFSDMEAYTALGRVGDEARWQPELLEE